MEVLWIGPVCPSENGIKIVQQKIGGLARNPGSCDYVSQIPSGASVSSTAQSHKNKNKNLNKGIIKWLPHVLHDLP